MTKLSSTKIGYPILADLPTYPYPIISDFRKPTYLPKLRISFLDDPLCDIFCLNNDQRELLQNRVRQVENASKVSNFEKGFRNQFVINNFNKL